MLPLKWGVSLTQDLHFFCAFCQDLTVGFVVEIVIWVAAIAILIGQLDSASWITPRATRLSNSSKPKTAILTISARFRRTNRQILGTKII